jgi:hypothetical protein
MSLFGEGAGGAMQCLACGAEMQLREVVLADIPTMPGFERHTFRCSACPQVARRLVICRAKMPVVDPLVPSAVSEAPTTNLQTGQQAAGVLPNAVEKLHSTQAALEDQDVTDWLPTVEKLSMALKERAVAARASAWAKTVEKLRSRQMALKERAVPVRTVDREFDRVWNAQCPDGVAPKPVASVPGLRNGGAT